LPADGPDLVILGGGFGGYCAAIRASQLGMKVSLVEEAKLGGTCLHLGCIPTKALLESSELIARVRDRGPEFGIKTGEVGCDLAAIGKRRDTVVETLHRGVQGLMRKNKVEVVTGHGVVRDKTTIEVAGKQLQAPNLLIATGSTPRSLPGIEIDGERIITSDHAVRAASIPRSVCIIGSGAVGVEFATFYREMGAEVTVVEALDRLVPLEDADVSEVLMKRFDRAGIHTRLSATVEEAALTGDAVTVKLASGEIKTDVVLVAVGRAPRTKDIGIEDAGVKLGAGGIVEVDEWLRTSVASIHAIGDAIGGYQLAHAAVHEGVTAVEDIAGKRVEPIRQELITRCTYCHPQIGSVGLTEAQAKEAGRDVKVGKFPFAAIGRAIIHGETEGFVKMVADAGSGELLGTHVIGPEATELISEPALAQLFQGVAWEVGRNVHPHPTLTEAIGEAAMAVDGVALNI
jgi:dihydrolipoamide dehydrogenase